MAPTLQQLNCLEDAKSALPAGIELAQAIASQPLIDAGQTRLQDLQSSQLCPPELSKLPSEQGDESHDPNLQRIVEQLAATSRRRLAFSGKGDRQ